MNKGFTLIELLVVVAIIGILAAVGTPIFQGFLVDAKINSSSDSHKRIISKIEATFAQCASGVYWAKLGGQNHVHECSDSIYVWDNWFVSYFNDSSFKNSYQPSANCCTTNISSPNLGYTQIKPGSGLPRRLIVKTNIGTENGSNKFIINTIIKE